MKGRKIIADTQNIYDTLSYVLCFFNFCIGFIAAGLNIFVIYALLVKRGIFRTHGSDVFVLGLTFTDFLSGIVLVFSIIVVFLDFGRTICLVQICFLQASMLCSALLVTLMTADRFLKIVHPFLYQRLCSVDLYPLSLTLTVYVVSFVIGFLPFVGAGSASESHEVDWSRCNYLQVIQVEFRIPYVLLMFVPIVTAVLLYSKIFHVAEKQIQTIAKMKGGPSKIPRGRYMKMIFIMAGLYFFFYIPPAMVNIISDISPSLFGSNNESRTILHLCSVGIITNCVVNPLIYAYTIPVVRNTFRAFIGLPADMYESQSIVPYSQVTSKSDSTWKPEKHKHTHHHHHGSHGPQGPQEGRNMQQPPSKRKRRPKGEDKDKTDKSDSSERKRRKAAKKEKKEKRSKRKKKVHPLPSKLSTIAEQSREITRSKQQFSALQLRESAATVTTNLSTSQTEQNSPHGLFKGPLGNVSEDIRPDLVDILETSTTDPMDTDNTVFEAATGPTNTSMSVSKEDYFQISMSVSKGEHVDASVTISRANHPELSKVSEEEGSAPSVPNNCKTDV